MYFRILGPLEVSDGRGTVPISSVKVRTLLIAFLTHANDVVSVDRLVDWLWPGGEPDTRTASLYAHISGLRRILEPARTPWSRHSVLITRPPGYLLRVPPGSLDVLCFEDLVRKGRIALDNGDTERARSYLREGLALWRGDALSDVGLVDAAQSEISRLEEVRLTALTLRLKADLALCGHLEAIPELLRLTAAHPLHEELHAMLMLALWRSGRRADALAVYERARTALAREMALEPQQSLRRIEAAIVAGEPACSR